MLNEERKEVRDARILLIGFAYKSGTSDIRESPSLDVALRLRDLGADLRVHDDHLPAEADLGLEVERVSCADDELEGADLVVVLVDHPDLPLERIAACSPLVLDTRACLRGHNFRGELL